MMRLKKGGDSGGDTSIGYPSSSRYELPTEISLLIIDTLFFRKGYFPPFVYVNISAPAILGRCICPTVTSDARTAF